MKSVDAIVLANDIGAGTSPALRLSIVLEAPVPSATGPRRQPLLTRPADDLSASGAPALPVSWHIAPSLTGRRRPSRVHPRASQGSSVSAHRGSLGRLSTRIQNVPPAKTRRSFRLLIHPPWSNLGVAADSLRSPLNANVRRSLNLKGCSQHAFTFIPQSTRE